MAIDIREFNLKRAELAPARPTQRRVRDVAPVNRPVPFVSTTSVRALAIEQFERTNSNRKIVGPG
jgi:hypothetical protein